MNSFKQLRAFFGCRVVFDAGYRPSAILLFFGKPQRAWVLHLLGPSSVFVYETLIPIDTSLPLFTLLDSNKI